MVTKEELMWINNFLGSVVGIALTGAFVLWRKLIEARQRDREVDTKHADDRATASLWQSEVLRKTEEIERLHDKLELVSSERNNAVQKIGSLEAHVEHLSQQVAHLSEQLEESEARSRKLEAMVQSMAAVNKQILERLEGHDNDRI